MQTILLPSDLNGALDRFAQQTGQSAAQIIEMALRAYLEDQQDILTAQAVLSRQEGRTSLASVRAEFGLDN